MRSHRVLLVLCSASPLVVPTSLALPLSTRDDLASPLKNRGSHWSGWSQTTNLFVFGDSYTSNGFNPLGPPPNATEPDGTVHTNTSTSADGSNWAEYLAESYNQSAVRLYDFAVGGATVNKTLAPEIYGIVNDFTEQVAWSFVPNFVQNKKNKALWKEENSLFATFFGINDVIDSHSKNNETLWNQIFDSYAATLEVLYASKARNFLLLKVPAINRSPGFNITSMGAADYSTLPVGIAAWNDRIDALAYNLTLKHADTTVFVFDTLRVFNQVLDYVGSYEATVALADTTTYCNSYANGTPNQTFYDPACAYTVNQYFWLNGLHPTWAMHDVMAQQISSILLGLQFGQVLVGT